MSDPHTHIRHAASTPHNFRLGTAKYKHAHKVKDTSAINFGDIPSTHAAYESSARSSKYYSTVPSWSDDLLTEEEKLARHPSNLKAVWGIEQVQDSQAAYEHILHPLIPGIAE